MKKIICLILAMVMLCLLPSCGEEKPIPANQNQNENYQYSATTVSSGDFSINPIRRMVWVTEFVDGVEDVTGDGFGVSHFFSDPDTNVSDFPSIALQGELKVATDEGYELQSRIEVYNTDLEPFAKYDSLSELTALGAGEYVIVLCEMYDSRRGDESIKNYTVRCDDLVFLLVVPTK